MTVTRCPRARIASTCTVTSGENNAGVKIPTIPKDYANLDAGGWSYYKKTSLPETIGRFSAYSWSFSACRAPEKISPGISTTKQLTYWSLQQ
jgi:hypothetical protein